MVDDFKAAGHSSTGLVDLPALLATVIEVGDLCYWDATNNRIDPADSQVDNVGEEDNQAEFARNFAGWAHGRSNDTDVTILVDTSLETLHSVTVPSAVYRAGSYLAASEDAAATGLEPQQLEATVSEDIAIAVVVDDDAAARTTVLCRAIRSVFQPELTRRMDVATTTLAADLVLTFDSPRVQILDPGGASRNVDLPAEEESAGLWLFIANRGSAAEILTIRNDAAATVGSLDGGTAGTTMEAGMWFCDGTTWVGFFGLAGT